MRITNYNELFGLFDKIISLSSDDDIFYCKYFTDSFRSVISSYDRIFGITQSRLCRNSHAGLLASSSLGLTSLISSSDKKKSHFYELSFLHVFPVLANFIREPLSYMCYNIYPKVEEVIFNRDLFVNDVNLLITYNCKVFIVHSYNEYDENTPFITLLSPSIMFKDETLCLEFIED